MKTFLLGCLFVATIAAQSSAQDGSAKVSEISAGGRGEVSIVPNRAVLVVGVENNANLAAAAGADNARLVASTMASLRAAGITESQLSNGGYSLSQDYENNDRRRPRGFTARNSIRIEVPNVSDVGKLIDAALAGGANIVSPIQYLGAGMPNARRDALKAAVAEARQDAETMAEASGGSLGRLLSMATGYSDARSVLGGMVMATSGTLGNEPTSIRPNDIRVVASATGRWEFVLRR